VALAGRTAVIVDDGIATGSTARAACQVARAQGAKRVVIAAPVAARQSVVELGSVADEVVTLEAPALFFAIGQFYRDFSQTPDREVVNLLSAAAGTPVPAEVEVEVGRLKLAARLALPLNAVGVVVFAHGSGSSRHSPRNRYVAGVLEEARLGTLLLDLLSVEEEQDRSNVFDVELLGERLVGVIGWLRGHSTPARHTPLGLFGASTGAAAAVWAAADPGAGVRAVVSRGGRPDLAASKLPAVTAPTLLIVGERDAAVLELNMEALEHLGGEGRLAVVPGATHLFEEPGALQEVALLARDWFVDHL
jgi:putative phosphoribosyl transferase